MIDPCILIKLLGGCSSNISPLPNNSSAPDESNIILESVFDETANEILAGKFALISPATTSADGL